MSQTIHTLKSYDGTSPPDFARINNLKTKRLLLGRHPRSFPRDSEFWYYYKFSQRRLERIQKGRSLVEVVSSSCLSPSPSLLDIDTSEEGGLFFPSRGSPLRPKLELAKPLENDAIDLKNRVKIHYGMSFVMLNAMGEVLCLSNSESEELRRVECKRSEQLGRADRYVFRLIDLNEPTSAGQVSLNSPVWLQITSETAPADHLLSEQGMVLGSKLFYAPRMASLQTEHKEMPYSSGEYSFSSPLPESLTSLNSNFEPSTTMEPLPTESADSSALLELAQRRRRRDAETAICGALAPIRIVHATRSENSDTTAKYKSRHARHLAQWIVRSAVRESEEASSEPGSPLFTLDPVYLEQDLYCVATTHGATLPQWPPRNTRSSAGDGDNRVFGCLRRVQIRDYSDKWLIDRKCVWRFCAVRTGDEAAHLLMNGVTDQKGQ